MNQKLLLSILILTSILVGLNPGIVTSPAAAEVLSSIVVSPTEGLETDENGGSATFSIVLEGPPSQPVKIDLESSDSTEGSISPTSVNLSPGTWDSPQIITVTGLADFIQDGDIAYTIFTHPSSSSDPEFDGLDAPDVAVINLDDAIPTANDDSDSFDEDTPITLDVLSNDSGLGDTPLTLSIVSFPASGSVEINPENSITYTPEINFNGDDILSYQVCDVDADCASAYVGLTVLPINDRPTAIPDLSDTLIDSEVSIDVIANDSDIDNDILLLETFDPSSSEGGTIIRLDLDTPENLSDDQLQYLPPAEYLGADTFNYTVSDGELTDIASVTITVHAGDELVAIDDSYIVGQNEILIMEAPGVLKNDVDPKNNSLTATIEFEPAHGDLDLHSDGAFSFTPDGTFIGTDLFTYQASNSANDSDSATVTIEISDQIPPIIDWISPGPPDDIYEFRNGEILLAVEAHDNDQISCVEFYRWDALKKEHIHLGTDCKYPYELIIDCSTLNYMWNEIFARASDRSGNWSVIQYLWLYRLFSLFLPILAHQNP